jgi:Na+/melibiose symporter-like transporter
VFDGVVDLTVGGLSDWRRARGGSRKPWVIAGGLTAIIACFFLFTPPVHVSLSYYLAWSLVYFVALTVSEIPHTAWGSELAPDYQSRARIFGFRSVSLQMGAAAFYALPLLPLYASSEYTPEVLRDAASIGALLTLVGLVWVSLAVPSGATIQPEAAGKHVLMRAILRNKPLQYLITAQATMALGYGMWTGLSFIYLDSYLHLGAYFSLIFLASLIWGAFSTPFWLRVIQRTSKSTAWATGVLIFIASLACMFFVPPGQLGWAAFLLVFVNPLCATISNVAVPSIMGDVVDYGKLKFHKDYGATYFAFITLVFKLSVGLGGGLSLGIAGLFGFSPSNAIHHPTSIFGLKLAFIIVPVCLHVVGLLLVLRTPLTRRRCEIIQRRLASRLTSGSNWSRLGPSGLTAPHHEIGLTKGAP